MTKVKDLLLNTNNYEHKTWKEVFPNGNVSLQKIPLRKKWREIIFPKTLKSYIKYLEEELSDCIKNGEEIYPYPDLVFNALNTTPLKKVKAVIIGQDPYFDYEEHNNTVIPQAMGLSFSVPHGIKVPSSLRNIYANLLRYGHIQKIPKHGNLIMWEYQGCLMLNASLTVKQGKKNRNCHARYWRIFTDRIIKHISENRENIIFVLWGAPALRKLKLVDQTKHKVIISSHPSGLSYKKPLRQYNPFADQDHFGIINEYLKKHNKREIIWRI